MDSLEGTPEAAMPASGIEISNKIATRTDIPSNIPPFGGVILGSNPSGVARVKGLRLTWAEQLIPKIEVE
jgi:hypothetical protein